MICLRKNTRTHKRRKIYVISIDFSHQRHMTFTHDPDNQCQIVVSFTTEVRSDMLALISNRNQSRSRRHGTKINIAAETDKFRT